MEALKTKKKALKTALTKLKEKVASSLDDADSSSLQLFDNKTNELLNDFKNLFNSIFETCKQEQVDDFINEKQSIDDSIDELRLTINRKKIKQETEHSNLSVLKSDTCVMSDVKLPTLSVPTFNGKIENWIMFKDMFVASVIENKSISNAMKLQYLKASCKDEALRVIQSISISDSNFNIAWKLLEDRYSNKRELLNAILKKLMSQPNINDSSNSILNLIDVTNECTRSLEVLNHKVKDLSETMIVFIIVEKLDKSTRYWWEKELNNSDDFGDLKQLISFLQSQARTLQNSKINDEVRKNNKFQNKVTSLISTSDSKTANFKCVKCRGAEFHGLHKCPEFLSLSVNDRYEFIKKNNLCFNCLKFHSVRNCMSTYRCQKCSKKHSTLIHFENENKNRQEIADGIDDASQESNLNPEVESFVFQTSVGAAINADRSNEGIINKTAILSTAVIHIKDCFGNYKSARALLDNASQSCFLTTEFADLLKIKKERISVAVSGLGSAKTEVNSKIRSTVSNLNGFEVQLDFLCIPKISNAIPINSLQITQEQIPSNVKLSDENFCRPKKIDCLLGAEVYYQLLRYGVINVPDSELKFQNSVFGFIATGCAPILQDKNTQNTHCCLIYDCSDVGNEIKQFEQLESIGIKNVLRDKEVDQSLEKIEKTVRFEDNRYEGKLPWKRDWTELDDNHGVTKKRLDSLARGFKKNPELNLQYRETLSDYENNGIIEKVLDSEKPLNKPVFCMPHQPVCKDKSLTSTMRINASSSPSFQHLSVDDHLFVGMQSLVDSLSNKENTKWFLLRAIGKIFDPLDLLTPFAIRVKCILQILWMKMLSWDEELPPDLQKLWSQWCSKIPRFFEIKIPRYVLNSSIDGLLDVIELHCFRDAIQKTYDVAIKTRVVKNCNVDVNPLVLMTRVAPLSKIILPQLELLGASLAARLARKVKPVIDRKGQSRVYFWTDSKIILHWIKVPSKRWKLFISNRVTENQSLCDSSAWAHCPGKQNHADFLSGSVSVEILISGLLWKGPKPLKEVEFPFDPGSTPDDIPLLKCFSFLKLLQAIKSDVSSNCFASVYVNIPKKCV